MSMPSTPGIVRKVASPATPSPARRARRPMLHLLPRRLANGQRVEVVVSAYREDLAWLRPLVRRQLAGADVEVTVYSKHPDTALVDGVASVALPNVGRCDHTYLHHIVTHWDRLADTTLFLPGTVHARWWQRLPLRLVLLPRLGAIEDFAAGAVRPLTAADRRLALDVHRAGDGDGGVVPARVRPFEAWWAANFPGRPLPRATAMGGVFAARRSALRRVPLSLWRALLVQHAAGDDVEVGHYMERAWYGLLRQR